MASRKTSKPMPGKPCGNVLYQRCNLSSPYTHCGEKQRMHKRICSQARANRPNFKFLNTTKVIFRDIPDRDAARRIGQP
jgi:hypothetical protein